jgi:Spy/CpxP family protein refolding chaperone
MKKFLIAAGAMMLIAGVSQAQTTDTKDTKDKAAEIHQRAGIKRGGGMGKDLNLSDEQKKQLKEVNESYRKQIADIRNNKSLSADEVKTKSNALRKELAGKRQALLTSEQKTQMADRRKDFTAKAKARNGRGMAQMQKGLGLTAEQSTKMQANRKDFSEKVKTIRADKNLTNTQKQEQIKELSKQNREAMKSILTPEQLEKMKAGRKNKGDSK